MSGPRTDAGKWLVAHLDSIARVPYSGVSFPDADYDVERIEAEARAAAIAECIAVVEGLLWFQPGATVTAMSGEVRSPRTMADAVEVYRSAVLDALRKVGEG